MYKVYFSGGLLDIQIPFIIKVSSLCSQNTATGNVLGQINPQHFHQISDNELKLNSFPFLQTVRMVYKTNSLGSIRISNQADEFYSCHFEMHHKYMQDQCVAINNSSGDSVGKMEFSGKPFSMHQ